MQRQPRFGHLVKSVYDFGKKKRFGHLVESVYDFGKKNKDEKWLKGAISQMGLREEWVTEDQSDKRFVKILLFFTFVLLIVANILSVICHRNFMDIYKPQWITNKGNNFFTKTLSP